MLKKGNMTKRWIDKADPNPAQTCSCVANVGTGGNSDEMPLGAMRDAAAVLRGTHDFAAFRSTGTETTTRTMPETPDARKEDSSLVRPACWKSRGAYFFLSTLAMSKRTKDERVHGHITQRQFRLAARIP